MGEFLTATERFLFSDLRLKFDSSELEKREALEPRKLQ